MLLKFLRTVVVIGILTGGLWSSAGAEAKISALVFGDYMYIPSHHDSLLDGKSGYVVRRIYFTYDNKMTERVSARLRLEMSQTDFGATKTQTMTPFLKDAWIKWKFTSQHALIAGISGTPTWGQVEKSWGYRWVIKTPLDLYKLGSSRDGGLALTRSGKTLGYHLMTGNGASTKNEADRGKKYYAAFSLGPPDKFVVQVYGDYQDSRGDEANTATYVVQAFVGLGLGGHRAGLLYAYTLREEGVGAEDLIVNVTSAYVVVKVTNRLKVFGRADHLDGPNPGAVGIAFLPMVPTAEWTTVGTVGFDWAATEKVHVSPNVMTAHYGDDIITGETPESDEYARITVYYKF